MATAKPKASPVWVIPRGRQNRVFNATKLLMSHGRACKGFSRGPGTIRTIEAFSGSFRRRTQTQCQRKPPRRSFAFLPTSSSVGKCSAVGLRKNRFRSPAALCILRPGVHGKPTGKAQSGPTSLRLNSHPSSEHRCTSTNRGRRSEHPPHPILPRPIRFMI